MREHEAPLRARGPQPARPSPGGPRPHLAPQGGDRVLPERDEKAAWVRSMFDTIAPRYDLVNTVMTLGLDRLWRHRTVASLSLPKGALVLDLGCGTGALARVAERAGYRVVGADMSAGMLAGMRASAISSVQCDAAVLPFPDGVFDGAISAYALRNITDLEACFEETARVVRPGGRIAILEVATPPRRLLHAAHALWFRRVVPKIGAALSDARAYRYLPESVVFLPDDAQLKRMMRAVGFSGVGRRLLQGGLSQLFFATRAGVRASAGVTTAP